MPGGRRSLAVTFVATYRANRAHFQGKTASSGRLGEFAYRYSENGGRLLVTARVGWLAGLEARMRAGPANVSGATAARQFMLIP